MAVVVSSKPLEEAKDPAAILSRAIRQLVPRPMIEAIGNNDVFVNVERREDSLSEHIHDVVIGIGTIVEFGAERTLPFLGLQDAMSIRGMKNEALEVELPDATNLRPRLQSEISVVTDTIGTFEKTNLGIEIRTDLAAFGEKFEPTILVV